MAVSILGALIIILYYIAVVSVGVWSGRKVHGVQSYPSGYVSLGRRYASRCRNPRDLVWGHQRRMVDIIGNQSVFKQAYRPFLIAYSLVTAEGNSFV
ncbi:hypothetical protein MTO96_051405 [Rhipicephalus appendiculatus]